MKKNLLTFALALLPMLGFSQHRSESEAIAVAQEFWGNKVNRAKLKAVPQSSLAKAKTRAMAKGTTSQTSNKQSFYVINDEEHNRFVIVSSDDRLYKILGYSDNGVFNGDSIPLGLTDVLVGYDQQYEYLLQNEAKIKMNARSKAGTKVEPFIKTKWGQADPFNSLCPENPDIITKFLLDQKNCATGCVATAMAQVMNYYQYPNYGVGSSSYVTSSYGFALSMDFSSQSFDWQNMANSYDVTASQLQKSAVAQLSYAAGMSVRMDYGPESGALPNNAAYALVNHFKYNPNIKCFYYDCFTSSDWTSIINEELANKRPIIYGASSSEGGHEFILDGCDEDGRYHINWGWKGKDDGYYELTALTPDDYDFCTDHSMICHISPQATEDTAYSDLYANYFVADFINQTKVGTNTSMSITTLRCCGSDYNSYADAFEGSIGIGVFDKDFNLIKTLQKRSITLNGGYYNEEITFSSIRFDPATFTEGGKFYIAPYCQKKNSNKINLLQTAGHLTDRYIATVKDGYVKLMLKGGVEDEEPEPVIPEGLIGTFDAKAMDKDNNIVKWQIVVSKDNSSSNKYLINGFVPNLTANNTVYGIMNAMGNIEIPSQSIGSTYTIHNYSSSKDIVLEISRSDSTMSISDTWGIVESDGNGVDTYVSQYRGTTFAYPSNNIEIDKPTITVDESSNTLAILCPTEGANIYYTTDGKSPSTSSMKYTGPITLIGNCTIKAVAEKNGKTSEVTQFDVKYFTVSIPKIIQDGNFVKLTSATDGAKLYYTLDGSEPSTAKGKEYNGSFAITNSSIIKVIGIKDGYNPSEIAEQSLVYIPTPDEIFYVQNNVAGQLKSRLGETGHAVKRLMVSGEINGTDVVVIRNMIISGALIDLDLENAKIVSGGDEYEPYTHAVTEDDVITSYMFEDCKSLISIKLPKDVKKIKNGSFANCNSLKRLDIPSQCVEVDNMAVSGCKNLEIISIPSSTTKLTGLMVYNCPNLKDFEVHKDNTVFYAKDNVLYSKNGERLVRYPEGKADEQFTIPSGIKIIGKEAFDYAKIKDVIIPETITTIEESAFENCSNLEKIVIPNSVKSIGRSAFSGCRRLVSVKMSDSVNSLEAFLFSGCYQLQEIEIGASVAKIDPLAFYQCKGMKSFNVDDANETYVSVNGVLYTSDMTTLVRCPMALYSDRFVIPNGVLTISNEAFASCINIKEFILPVGLTTIGNNAFEDCTMTAVAIPTTVSVIKSNAFSNCKNLTSFVIPEGVNTIESFVLSNCKSLSFLRIPSTVQAIGTWALYNMPKLTTIYSHVQDANNISVNYSEYDKAYDGIEKIASDCTWHVQKGCADTYKAQPWWISTWNIIDDLDPVVGIASIANDADMQVIPNGHSVDIISSSDKTINVYNIHGHIVNSVRVKAGQTTTIPLQSGVYVINRNKIVIK